MTREEVIEIANDVLANRTRSHVQAARDLSEYVIGCVLAEAFIEIGWAINRSNARRVWMRAEIDAESPDSSP